jgi:hypothetical protein
VLGDEEDIETLKTARERETSLIKMQIHETASSSELLFV